MKHHNNQRHRNYKNNSCDCGCNDHNCSCGCNDHNCSCGCNEHNYNCGCNEHNCNCGDTHDCDCTNNGFSRQFISKDEIIEELEMYKSELMKEIKGVDEEIARIKAEKK